MDTDYEYNGRLAWIIEALKSPELHARTRGRLEEALLDELGLTEEVKDQ